MRSSRNRALVGILALLAWVLLPAAAHATERIVHFKNGRALRVLDVRDEGEWIYLILSEPKTPERKQTAASIQAAAELTEDDLAREMGVRASTVEKIEVARTGPGDSKKSTPMRTANGVVQQPGAYDGTGNSRGYVVKAPSAEEMARRLLERENQAEQQNTASVKDGPATAEEIARSNEALDNVDLSKTLAGGDMRMNQRNLKVPNYIMQRARQVQAQRQQERAAQRRAMQEAALGAQQGGGAAAEPDDTADAADDTSAEPER